MGKGTIRQLEVFLAAVNEGSFSKAASSLGVSQGVVSRHIQALERERGALFSRVKGSRATLSGAGAALYEKIPSLLAEIDNIQSKESDTVRIGAGPYLKERLKSHLLGFLSECPLVCLDLVEVDSIEEGRAAIQADDIDLLYFTHSRPELTPGAEILRTVKVGLYCSGNLVPRADVSGRLPFVMPYPGTPQERFVIRYLQSLGVAFEPLARAPDFETARQMAVRGMGWLCTYDEMVESYVLSGDLISCDEFSSSFYRQQLQNPQLPLSKAASRFSAYAKALLCSPMSI